MPDDGKSNLENTCSSTLPAGGTTHSCTQVERKILSIKWDRPETWCSENAPISGTTLNYGNGEQIDIAVTDRIDGSAVKSLKGTVSSDTFRDPWPLVIDILPTGGPSWNWEREFDGKAGGVVTPEPEIMRFIPNVKRGRKNHTAEYDRTDPGATAPKKVGVSCRFELEAINYLLTIYGELKYVRGRGRERLELGDSSLSGGFTLYSKTQHWGYKDAATGKFKYWNGSAWQDTPAAWVPDNSNHFGIAFYKSGSSWKCRDAPSQSWPQALSDWPDSQYKGPGNPTDTTLGTWKSNIDAVWTDKFDIKRKECKSTVPECCRYKTRCVTSFTEVDSYGDNIIIIVYEDVRSDSGMWALADTRYGLAPHEFGHLLGAPDEYSGVGTAQLGVTDGDGLSNGVDDNSIMGVNMTTVKKRHYKGICEVFALLVRDEVGKTYTYEAVGKASTLASPAGTPAAPKPPSRGLSGSVVGAIIGGIIGAIVGAIIGFVASGGNPAGAALGALAGATAGALIGAGIGSLF